MNNGSRQQRLIAAIFRNYQRNCLDQRIRFSLLHPEVVDNTLVFDVDHGGWGADMWDVLYQLSQLLQFAEKTHKLYEHNKVPCLVKMNGDLWEAFGSDTLAICKERVLAKIQKDKEEYEASPAYKAQQELDARNRAANLQHADAIASQLDTDFSLLELAQWMTRYVPAINQVGASTVEGVAAIASKLESMGYVNGESVNIDMKQAPFEVRVRYLAGQILSHYRQASGPLVPHEMVAMLAQEAINIHLSIVDESTTSYD